VTPGGWLKRAERLYERHGAALGQTATVAHDEALYLILRTLGLPLDSPPSALGRRLSAPQSAAIADVLHRRLVDRVPAAYITREAWLGGLRFHVDERVLIPRSYFVEILPGQVDPWLRDPAGVTRVADVCTGSGCLAVLLARHFRRAQVDAIDVSADALEVARINVRRHRLSGRVRLLEGDMLGPAPAGRYDVILCNPPYETTAHVNALPAEFRREPRVALDGGPDGLGLIRLLIRQSARRLKPRGVLMVEVGGGRAAFDREFGHLDPYWFHTADGSDCACLIQAERLAPGHARARS
jgi:ribosomal protein L3 glutamine methyltransferase